LLFFFAVLLPFVVNKDYLMNKTNVENGPCDKSKTAPTGPFWSSKTAHAKFKTAKAQTEITKAAQN